MAVNPQPLTDEAISMYEDCAARRQILHQRVGCQEVRDCHGATVIVSKHWQLLGAAPRNDVSRHQNQEMRIKKLSIFKN